LQGWKKLAKSKDLLGTRPMKNKKSEAAVGQKNGRIDKGVESLEQNKNQ
jgi:hypothetical protein